jgi:hypothetical protein
VAVRTQARTFGGGGGCPGRCCPTVADLGTRERERASVMCGRAGLVAGVQLWGVSPLTSIGPPLADRN